MKIGYDLDGIGYSFGLSVSRYLNTVGVRLPTATDQFCKHWDFYKFWGMDKEEFAQHCHDGVNNGIIFGPGWKLTRPGFFESLARTKGMGHTNVVITHRYQGAPGNAEMNTEEWLKPVRHLVDELHYSHDKTLVDTDMFVEDNAGNYDKLVAAGVDAYLVNRPWNAPYDDHRVRINDVTEYADMVQARTNGLIVV